MALVLCCTLGAVALATLAAGDWPTATPAENANGITQHEIFKKNFERVICTGSLRPASLADWCCSSSDLQLIVLLPVRASLTKGRAGGGCESSVACPTYYKVW